MTDYQWNTTREPDAEVGMQIQVCNKEYVFTCYITPELSVCYLEMPAKGILVGWVRSCLLENGKKKSVKAALVRTTEGELYLADPVAYP
ncbi:hypothetical protein [Foetidibacter luteolus]|uniref:hypothetical protein n=1 Tax=Foetidibacter luteolus TaxID=2608880 RepID=UPI00129A1696|nr:hypothetical protein [Foetidibacter luteolus]